jgi:predicted MPP superfamily phosphohydrolase
MKYKWLHLSDLHSYCNGINTKIMRDALINEIEVLHKKEPFSFLIITGDISDKNQGYGKAIEFINEIMNVADLSAESVFLVPGNHDLDRNIPDNREEIVKELWNKDILDKSEEDSIELLINSQNDFFQAYESLLNRSYPAEDLHFRENFDENLNIFHFNTSWMCYDSVLENGKLHIGLNKIYSCMEKVEKKPINIAIGHHSISELKEMVGSKLKFLFKYNDIDLYLSGHTHDSLVVYDTSIDTEFCTCRQVRAEDDNYPAGFIIGNIDTEEDQSHFVFYNWDNKLTKWTYDYTVEPAKHGVYYLKGNKFNNIKRKNNDIIVDLKLMGPALDCNIIKEKFKLKGAKEYRLGHKNIRPKKVEEWNKYLEDLSHFYDSIINNEKSGSKIHIFPMAPIPLLVSMGYLMQNGSPNIRIYQYNENKHTWVYNKNDDNILINEKYSEKGNDILAVSLSISAHVKIEDINAVLGEKYDLLNIYIDNPHLSYLNYKADVLRVKSKLKEKLDSINYKYKEIHLFLASPAGLSIEIGRIIRENMYPDTYIYNYFRKNNPSYSRIYNLMEVRNMS